jgi:hypothetical protein
VLDWLKVRRENALRDDARYAAGTTTITNYHGALPAAELHSSAKDDRLLWNLVANTAKLSRRP